VGEFIRVEEELTSEKLTTLIKAVLDTPSYRENARKFQLIIEETRGLDVAADVIETACMAVREPAPY
jgi:zeaxanthin glucosyltransferase